MDEVTFLLADNPSECVPAIARWMRVRLTVLLSGNKTIDYGFISPPPADIHTSKLCFISFSFV